MVSSTLDRVDWNAELVHGDLGTPFSSSTGVGQGAFGLRRETPAGVSGVGIDRRVRVRRAAQVSEPWPIVAGLSTHIDLTLVSRLDFGSGAVAMRYVRRR